MSWVNEIYRGLFVAFGAMQLLTNLGFLLKSNGDQLARKQHQEVPPTISAKQMRVKIWLMLSFGILFISVGLYSYINRLFPLQLSLLLLGLFALYALSEALYYKYWKTIGFALISIILFSILIFSN
ncbi:hypothetical protein IGI39_003042 [Enterococcus sp. AZ135]|uniref:hypothetical protein n=1 Tax=unclassified Enterococcus TaxID=2608891 RepID=UPI003F2854C4